MPCLNLNSFNTIFYKVEFVLISQKLNNIFVKFVSKFAALHWMPFYLESFGNVYVCCKIIRCVAALQSLVLARRSNVNLYARD